MVQYEPPAGLSPAAVGTLIDSALLSVAVILVISWFMPRKTRKGSIPWKKIAGLEEYIRRTEVKHIQLREQQGVFERLLPYAICFFGWQTVWHPRLTTWALSHPIGIEPPIQPGSRRLC